MRRALANIFWLGTKEVRSMLHDYALLGLLIYSFSLAIYAQAQGTMGELHSAAIAIGDEDRSPVSSADVDRLLDTAVYTFMRDIPPHFARDVVAGRTPAVQVEVDATAAMQAGIGAATSSRSWRRRSRDMPRARMQCWLIL